MTISTGERLGKYFEQQSDGWEWVHAMLADDQRGTLVLDDRRLTSEYLNQWLEQQTQLTPSARDKYRLSIKLFLPADGKVRLCDLRPPLFKARIAELDRAGYAGHTVSLAVRIMKQALNAAVDDELLARNPMRKIKYAQPKTTRRALSGDEADALLSAARETKWDVFVLVLVATGLRVSECLGTRWSDIDLQTGVLCPCVQTGRIPHQPGVHLSPLKSESSGQPIMLPPMVLQALASHRTTQNEQKLAGPGTWQEHDLVFPGRHGQPVYRSVPDAAFKAIAKAAGIPDATPHTLRHTFITRLQQDGLPLAEASRLARHARPSTTANTYSHPSLTVARQGASITQRWLTSPLLTAESAG